MRVAACVLAGMVIVVGATPVVRADAGTDTLTDIFAWLGVLMVVAGLALIGRGLLLRSRDRREPTD